MSCHCCLKLVKRLFEKNDIVVDDIGLGEASVTFDDDTIDLDGVAKLLEADGFELLMDKDKQLIEQIKSAVIDLVHHSTFNAMVRNSDYLVEKFVKNYDKAV